MDICASFYVTGFCPSRDNCEFIHLPYHTLASIFRKDDALPQPIFVSTNATLSHDSQRYGYTVPTAELVPRDMPQQNMGSLSHNSFLWRTSLCKHFVAYGGAWCPLGDYCNYIHDMSLLPCITLFGRPVGHCLSYVQSHCARRNCEFFHPIDVEPYKKYTPCIAWPTCKQRDCYYRHRDQVPKPGQPMPHEGLRAGSRRYNGTTYFPVYEGHFSLFDAMDQSSNSGGSTPSHAQTRNCESPATETSHYQEAYTVHVDRRASARTSRPLLRVEIPHQTFDGFGAENAKRQRSKTQVLRDGYRPQPMSAPARKDSGPRTAPEASQGWFSAIENLSIQDGTISNWLSAPMKGDESPNNTMNRLLVSAMDASGDYPWVSTAGDERPWSASELLRLPHDKPKSHGRNPAQFVTASAVKAHVPSSSVNSADGRAEQDGVEPSSAKGSRRPRTPWRMTYSPVENLPPYGRSLLSAFTPVEDRDSDLPRTATGACYPVGSAEKDDIGVLVTKEDRRPRTATEASYPPWFT